jgi:hypothetical protein
MLGSSWEAAQLAASEEGLSFVSEWGLKCSGRDVMQERKSTCHTALTRWFLELNCRFRYFVVSWLWLWFMLPVMCYMWLSESHYMKYEYEFRNLKKAGDRLASEANIRFSRKPCCMELVHEHLKHLKAPLTLSVKTLRFAHSVGESRVIVPTF